MSSWMNDTAVQNHNGAGFNLLDPSSGGPMLDPTTFMNNPASFDAAQFQNQQLQQRMQNGGGMRNGNGSPAFNSPVYQTNSLVPAKRSRPMEDSIAGSPRQAPGMLPQSRSQTPQQNPYPGFPQTGNAPVQLPPQQTSYAHLQNGSANASPSPIMSNQLRPGGVPQRVATASPHPFSPAGQQFSQASPSQSEHGSQANTPQSGNVYAQNPAFNPAFNQSFAPQPGRSPAPPQQNAMPTSLMQQSHMQQPGMYQPGHPQQRPTNSQEQQKLVYHMQLQQQLQHSQQRNMMAQRTNMPPNMNPMAKGPMQGLNGQYAGMRPQQPPGPQQGRGSNLENMMKSLTTFMETRKLPLDLNPIVGDRSISILNLYLMVGKLGGYKKVTAQNAWMQVAQGLGFHPQQHQSAPIQLKTHYERNLAQFEEAWQMKQQQMQHAQRMQQSVNMGGGPQMSPTKQMNPQAATQQSQSFIQQQLLGQQAHLQQQHAQTTPVKQMAAMHHTPQTSINGFSTPQFQGVPPQMGHQSHGRNSLSRSVDLISPQNGALFSVQSPMSTKSESLARLSMSNGTPQVAVPEPPPEEFFLADTLVPKVRRLDTYGGIDVESLEKVGKALKSFKPDIPSIHDLGIMDIHALTMSLQSGIHAEVRMALDTLATISREERLFFDLRMCEDLVETLIDCAEVQVELLAENAAEVSDVMLVNSYEDIIRGSRAEQEILQDIPAFGSLEYALDRAVDKLICITTILRNFSFFESNHAILADEFVVKFLCVVIRYLGTRNMLLKTNANTLDFMKDVIILLDNIAHSIELPGREQALCLLHFLLAFAPCPPPNLSGDSVAFSSYDPAIHRYLPPAVFSLAKLLARDEPNRTHYKTIFASDVASSPPYDLLTRTFGLAISPIPEDKQEPKGGAPMPEARKAILMQGMLAAEILSNLAPGYESGVAKSWLTSEDGFSQNLCRLILQLCLETPPPPAGPQHQRNQLPPRGMEDEALLHITTGGIAVLRRLAEKSRDPDDLTSAVPFAGMPPKETLLAALKIVQPRLQGVLKQLCAYAGLGT